MDRIVLDYVSPDGASVTHVRSTLIGSSLETLRSLELHQRFVAVLPHRYHQEILYTLAPTWQPVEVAVAYYQTWEDLGLSEQALAQASKAGCERLMGSLFATVLRGARVSGANPWMPIGQLDRVWARLFQGGTVRVVEKGPKEALLELRGLPMLRGRYFRFSLHNLLHAAGGLFARKLYLREITTANRESYTAVASWV